MLRTNKDFSIPVLITEFQYWIGPLSTEDMYWKCNEILLCDVQISVSSANISGTNQSFNLTSYNQNDAVNMGQMKLLFV